MEKRYRILWIEDEPDKNEAFVETADLNGIDLIQYHTSHSGIEELKSNVDLYDGVILDAKGYNESKDEKTGLSGLMNSIKEIQTLSIQLPYFIFTGYLGEDGNESARDMLVNETIFTKGIDNKKLLNAVKAAADKIQTTQIRHDFSNIFKILEEYGAENQRTVLQILEAIRNGVVQLDDNLYFTPLRKILETMFRKANDIGLLHDACVSKNGSQVNLTESSLFLSGIACHSSKVKCTQTHFPKVISKAVKQILELTGAASHTTDVDITENIDVQQLRTYVNTPYLLYGILFQLADVLIWFDKYSEANKDVEVNKSYWVTVEDVGARVDLAGPDKKLTGKVIKVENGWGTFSIDDSKVTLSVIPTDVTKYNIKLGDKFSVTTKPSPDGMKTYIDKIIMD